MSELYKTRFDFTGQTKKLKLQKLEVNTQESVKFSKKISQLNSTLKHKKLCL